MLRKNNILLSGNMDRVLLRIWNQTLKDSLSSAAGDKDEKKFLQTMRQMVAHLHDGHGNVTHTSERTMARTTGSFQLGGK